MKRPILSKNEEIELIRRWQDEGDVAARNRVIEAHVPLAMAVANKFSRFKMPSEDMVQEGIIGLIDAMSHFDPAKGFRFSTLARWYVLAAVQTYLFRAHNAVRMPETRKMKDDFFAGRVQKHSSLDIQTMDGSTMGDNIVDDAPNPEEIVSQVIEAEHEKRRIKNALRKLPPRTRDIVRQRYMKDDSVTLKTLGEKYGVSHERVRQIEADGLKMLRKRLEKAR